MKFIPSFLLVVMFLFCQPVLSESKHHPMEQSVFQFFKNGFRSGFKLQPSGTIFYIGNNLFVTNAHTLMQSLLIDKSNAHKKISETHFFRHKDEIIPFERIRDIDIASDISILELSEETFEAIKSSLTPLKLAKNTKNFKKKGFLYGFPQKYLPLYGFQEQPFRKIRFKGVKEVYGEDSNLWVLADEVDLAGISGGPALIDNEVIGVIRTNSDNYLGISSFKEISSLLKKNEKILTLGGIKKRKRFKRYAEQYLNSPKTNSWDKNTHTLLMGAVNRQRMLLDLKWKNYFEYYFEKKVEVKTEEKRKKQIIKWMKKSIKIAWFPGLVDSVAELYLEKGDIKKAKEILAFSSHFYIRHILAELYLEEGHIKKAIENYKLSAKGNYAAGLFTTALWYFTEERWLKYEKYMKRAVLRGHVVAPYHLSLYYMDKLGVKEFRKKFSKAKWARFSKENILNVLKYEKLGYEDFENSSDEYLKIFSEYKKSRLRSSNMNTSVTKKEKNKPTLSSCKDSF